MASHSRSRLSLRRFLLLLRLPPTSTLFPYTTLFRSVSALGATDRVHQAGAPQAQEDLLDVVVRQPLLLGELARRDRPLPRTLREVHGDDQPVLGPGGDAHGINMGG